MIRKVCVCARMRECEALHACCGALLPDEDPHSDWLWVGFQFAHWPEALAAVPLCHGSAPGFFYFFKQSFETTTGILSIISWKFIVVRLQYH